MFVPLKIGLSPPCCSIFFSRIDMCYEDKLFTFEGMTFRYVNREMKNSILWSVCQTYFFLISTLSWCETKQVSSISFRRVIKNGSQYRILQMQIPPKSWRCHGCHVHHPSYKRCEKEKKELDVLKDTSLRTEGAKKNLKRKGSQKEENRGYIDKRKKNVIWQYLRCFSYEEYGGE